MARSPESDVPAPVHGTRAGDRVSDDRIVVECRKPDNGRQTIRMSGNHHGYRIIARMNATAMVEAGFTNVRT